MATNSIGGTRTAFFDDQAVEIAHNYGRGRAIVAVDGLVGTDAVGADLVDALVRQGLFAVHARIDDFVRPRGLRRRPGHELGEAFYLDRYDYATFRRVLVEPFKLGGGTGFVTAAFDESRDAPVEPVWKSAGPDAILVVTGPFLSRPELRGLFNYTIYLETHALPDSPAAAAELYTVDAEPRFAATAIVDTSFPERPRRVFTDSC